MPLINRVGGGSADLQSGKSATPTTFPKTYYPDAGYDGFSNFEVNAIPASYIIPNGSKDITQNGEHDVSEYSSVNVNVSSGHISSRESLSLGVGTHDSFEFTMDTTNLAGFYVCNTALTGMENHPNIECLESIFVNLTEGWCIFNTIVSGSIVSSYSNQIDGSVSYTSQNVTITVSGMSEGVIKVTTGSNWFIYKIYKS